MVIKRKTVSKLACTSKVTRKDDVQEDIEEDVDAQIVPVEEKKELSERELGDARSKELKSMAAADLKALLLSNGLETGTKEVMIKSLLKHEAKLRAGAREQKAKIRGVVVEKKQELESLSTAELSKLCDSSGFKGLRSKEERIQRLLVQWQEKDGVDKALAEMAQKERKQELEALESNKLLKMCNKIGVDPFVKEIMVDRISKQENDAGCYARPALTQENEVTAADKPLDMVDALLANEAQRKRDKELNSQQEDVAAQKRKELKCLSVDDLKKRLAKKGLEPSGKKEEMVESLFVTIMQEEAVIARRTELKSKSLQELKDLVSRNRLQSGGKEEMVKSLLAYEAKCREDLKAFEVQVGEAAKQKKDELEKKTNASLKDLCVAKGLAVGGGKEDRIERIVDDVQKDGELDEIVCKNIRNKRKEELMSMDKPLVAKLCEEKEVDPVVRDIIVERILAHESEGGAAIAMNDAEPAPKRARVSKK